MLVIEVDCLDAESLETRFAGSAHVIGFAADAARKGTPRLEAANENPATPARPSPVVPSVPPVVFGAAAPAVAAELVREPAPAPAADLDFVRSTILNALGNADLTMLGSMLDAGEWSVAGNALTIKVAAFNAAGSYGPYSPNSAPITFVPVPSIALSTTGLNASTQVGSTPGAASFTVRNFARSVD